MYNNCLVLGRVIIPFNPILGATMAGIGSLDQTGSLTQGIKRGLGSYAMGQGLRYLGGGNFQPLQNPFATGGAFTESGFTSGFSSPFGTETGIALEEIERHKAKVIEIDAENADNALEKMAKEGYIVASNDKVLRKRIKGFGGPVIYLRQSRFLKKD